MKNYGHESKLHLKKKKYWIKRLTNLGFDVFEEFKPFFDKQDRIDVFAKKGNIIWTVEIETNEFGRHVISNIKKIEKLAVDKLIVDCCSYSLALKLLDEIKNLRLPNNISVYYRSRPFNEQKADNLNFYVKSRRHIYSNIPYHKDEIVYYYNLILELIKKQKKITKRKLLNFLGIEYPTCSKQDQNRFFKVNYVLRLLGRDLQISYSTRRINANRYITIYSFFDKNKINKGYFLPVSNQIVSMQKYIDYLNDKELWLHGHPKNTPRKGYRHYYESNRTTFLTQFHSQLPLYVFRFLDYLEKNSGKPIDLGDIKENLNLTHIQIVHSINTLWDYDFPILFEGPVIYFKYNWLHFRLTSNEKEIKRKQKSFPKDTKIPFKKIVIPTTLDHILPKGYLCDYTLRK